MTRETSVKRGANGIGQPAARVRQAFDRGRDHVVQRHHLAPVVLGQRADQRADQLLTQAGHLPVEAVVGDAVQHREGDVHRDPVVGGPGLETVRELEDQIALVPHLRESLDVVGRARSEQALACDRQQFGVRSALLLPPLIEVPSGHHLVAEACVVERMDRVVVGQAAASSSLLERTQLLDHIAVVLDEMVVRLPIAFDQCVTDEHPPGEHWIGAIEPHGASSHDGQPVQRDLLCGHRTAATAVPPWLAVRPPDEVLAGALGPFRLDAGRRARPQPIRLDQLRRHDPSWELLGECGTAGDSKCRAVGAPVVARGAIAHAQVRQQPRHQRLVDAIGMAGPHRTRGRGGLARMGREVDAERADDLAQLAVQVLPLAHSQVVQELAAAQLAELARAQLLLPFAQVVPQPDVREEVGVVGGEPAVGLVGGLLGVGGALAGVLDGQRCSDDQHLAHAVQPVGFQHHPPEPRIDR